MKKEGAGSQIWHGISEPERIVEKIVKKAGKGVMGVLRKKSEVETTDTYDSTKLANLRQKMEDQDQSKKGN